MHSNDPVSDHLLEFGDGKPFRAKLNSGLIVLEPLAQIRNSQDEPLPTTKKHMRTDQN